MVIILVNLQRYTFFEKELEELNVGARLALVLIINLHDFSFSLTTKNTKSVHKGTQSLFTKAHKEKSNHTESQKSNKSPFRQNIQISTIKPKNKS